MKIIHPLSITLREARDIFFHNLPRWEALHHFQSIDMTWVIRWWVEYLAKEVLVIMCLQQVIKSERNKATLFTATKSNIKYHVSWMIHFYFTRNTFVSGKRYINVTSDNQLCVQSTFIVREQTNLILEEEIKE